MTDITRNTLANASSPYLRQHAGNPVHWQTWSPATLAQARATDTPILLSAGYSACHWCHVMAHECFENVDIAAAMNTNFVCIKLDREERPDIDHVYQLAHQAFHGRGGGWPLTAFIDPQNLAPFFVGTYFPPEPRHGLPGFPELLTRARSYFDEHRHELREQADALREWMAHAEAGASGALPDAQATQAQSLQRLAARFDKANGGSMGAPKFPRAAELEWLLDRRADPTAARMARITLAAMASRGLQDQLGGGFFRYCVDADWSIPHFEKMLYDNAQLLPVYARMAADAATNAPLRALARDATHGIVDWLAREMTSGCGLFYSALDADSEHEEGKFYLWTRGQVQAMLDADHYAIAAPAWGLDQSPNFEGRAWHLQRRIALDELAANPERSAQFVAETLAAARQSLFAARAMRVRPACDDKQLTAWNALTIAGLARSARLLDDTRCATLARTALDSLRERVWIDGALYANVAPPAQRIPGFLDDYAFLLDALLETLQRRFAPTDLDWAIALADGLLARFTDPANGGFWFAADEHATPLARGRHTTDDALPNGNAVAIRSLLRLGHLLGEPRYLDAAHRALTAAAGALTQFPDACLGLLRALVEAEQPRPQIVVRCAPAQAPAWIDAARAALTGFSLTLGGDPIDVFVIDADAHGLPGVLAARAVSSVDGTAYVCAGLTCQSPVTSPDALHTAVQTALDR